jgi:hypothetical protein
MSHQACPGPFAVTSMSRWVGDEPMGGRAAYFRLDSPGGILEKDSVTAAGFHT